MTNSHHPSSAGDRDEQSDVHSAPPTTSTAFPHSNISFGSKPLTQQRISPSCENSENESMSPSQLESNSAARTILALAGVAAAESAGLSSVMGTSITERDGKTETNLTSKKSSISQQKSSRSNLRKQSPGERLQRSRERNRMHARKTRQRKKEHMKNLQDRVDELKTEQIKLRQTINEKNTANILVGLFSKSSDDSKVEDPRVEGLLRRPVEEIPDASKIPELPALILPGHHSSKWSKRGRSSAPSSPASDSTAKALAEMKTKLPDDGIDYALLGKDRSKCTPAELDQIRRERNRMHAKRTRDRKRIFMEEMENIIQTLEGENDVLVKHLSGIKSPTGSTSPVMVSPTLVSKSSSAPEGEELERESTQSSSTSTISERGSLADGAASGIKNTLDLLSSAVSAVSSFSYVSCSGSDQDQDEVELGDEAPKTKRRKVNDSCAVQGSLLSSSSVPTPVANAAAATT